MAGQTVSTGAAGAAGGVHAHRVIFIDLGRFLALVFMLYGHTVSALLATEYQRGTWFDVWQFQRGLTSSLFLLLSGFAFSVATTRHWHAHTRLSPAFWKRIRRFALLIVMGYALHFPVPHFEMLATATRDQWRNFLVSDVLQLIGVTLLSIQLLVLVTRTRQVFTVTALSLSFLMLAVTHAVWAVDWLRVAPMAVAAYLSSATGSLFPLFPWSCYVLFGAALGQIYVGWGAARLSSYAAFVLLVPGTLLVAFAWGMGFVDGAPWGDDPWNFMPVQVPLRIGSCLVILSAIARASQRVTRLPRFFSAVAQETLPIYFVHLCIVYGSIWNSGLMRAFGAALGPIETLAWVLVLLASMGALGWYWHWLKSARPRLATWTTAGVAVLLTVRLL